MSMFDWLLMTVTVLVEKCVLLLGPLLILFASTIIGGLAHTFFTIMVPMMNRAWDTSPYKHIVIGFHICIVLFLLIEITFNYYMCVMTKNYDKKSSSSNKVSSSSYDKVVHELAEVTNFQYPETPQEINQYKHEYNDRMMLRMRRRQEIDTRRTNSNNHLEQTTTQQQSTTSPTSSSSLSRHNDNENGNISNNNNGLASTSTSTPSSSSDTAPQQRKNISTKNKTNNKKQTPTTTVKLPNPKQVRNWMLMAPDEWGFCSRTQQPKPPRSHYDHVTKTLVLCLDHYCPWMFNAVGYFNYRYFCCFLWYVEMGMMYGMIMSYRAFMNCSGPYYRKQVVEFRKTGVWNRTYDYTPIPSERTPITLSFMLCLAVGIAVACLGGFHLYLTLTGQTTIEFHGNLMNKSKARRLGQKYRNPYDLGWKRNVQQVFGFQRSFLMSFLIPSTREPEYLPLPINGEDGKRKHLRKSSVTKHTMTLDNGVGGVDESLDERERLIQNSTESASSSLIKASIV